MMSTAEKWPWTTVFRDPVWVRRGVAVLAAVLVVAALLWWLWPSPPGPVALHAGTPDRIVTVTVERPRLGSSDIEIALADRDGKAVADAVIRVDVVEPRMGVADPSVTAAATAPGRYRAAAVPFMSTGQWELRLTVDGTAPLVLPVWIGG
jgi:hypothetical protein